MSGCKKRLFDLPRLDLDLMAIVRQRKKAERLPGLWFSHRYRI